MNAVSKPAEYVLLALACLTIMVGCVIVPGLPDVAAQLGVASYASWLVTMPALGVVVFGPLAAWVIGRAGLYRALCGGLFAYGLLGAAGALLYSPIPVFTDRLLLGAATAVVMSSGTGLIALFYDGAERLGMIARQGMSIELGGVIFLALGGVLATVDWYLPFTLYLIAWLFLGLVVTFVPIPVRSAISVQSPPDQAAPRTLQTIYAAALMSMVIFFTGVIVLPFRVHELGLSQAQTGYLLSFISLVAVGAAATLPGVTRRIGAHRTLCVAFAFYALAHLLYYLASSITLIIAGAVAMGIGFGLSVPLVNHMTVEQSPVQQRAKSLAYLSMALFSGQFLSSFMALVPGSRSSIFAAAALLAMVVAVTLGAFGKREAVGTRRNR